MSHHLSWSCTVHLIPSNQSHQCFLCKICQFNHFSRPLALRTKSKLPFCFTGNIASPPNSSPWIYSWLLKSAVHRATRGIIFKCMSHHWNSSDFSYHSKENMTSLVDPKAICHLVPGHLSDLPVHSISCSPSKDFQECLMDTWENGFRGEGNQWPMRIERSRGRIHGGRGIRRVSWAYGKKKGKRYLHTGIECTLIRFTLPPPHTLPNL